MFIYSVYFYDEIDEKMATDKGLVSAETFKEATEKVGEQMLALSRKKNEAIIVNNNVEITILEIKGDQVKLGISAPREVPVYRKEVYVQIQEANKAATETDTLDALKDLFQKVQGHVERHGLK